MRTKLQIAIPEYVAILSEEDINQLRKFGNVELSKDFPATEDEIVKRIGAANIILIKWLIFSDSLLRRLPNLKYIITLSVGYNHIDVKTATQLGIKILTCPTHNTHAVVEHTFALLFSLSRRIVEAQSRLQKGAWIHPYNFPGTELAGKKLLVIGQGKIGKEVAQIAKCFGLIVDTANSSTTPAQLNELIQNADIISLHVPLTKATRRLINKERLSLMKNTAYIINTSRGEIIDQKVLFNALKNKQIAGAGLDVFEHEPISGSLPKEIIELINLPNVVATPHMAFNTKEASRRLGAELLSNLKSIILGKPKNLVN